MANTQYFTKEDRMATAGEYSKMQATSKADALRQQQQAQERLKLAGNISGIETQVLQETLQDDAFQDYYIPQNEQELQELASQLESENPEAQELLKEQAEAAGQSIEEYLNMSDPNIIEFLVRGAKLQCRKGSHLRKLNIPLCHGVYEGKNPMLHKLDCIVGDDWNIPTFGVCSSGSPELNTPKVMLQEEEYDPENYYESKGPTGKNIKGKACSPAIIGTWQETYDLTRIVDNGQKDPGDKHKSSKDTSKGKPALTLHSFLICKYGGLIEPLTSGQEHVPEASDYKTPEDQQKAEELQAKHEAEEKAKENSGQEAMEQMPVSEEARKLQLAGSVVDLQNGVLLASGETYVGGRRCAPRSQQVSQDFLDYVNEMCEISDIDYYFALAIMLHETGFDAFSHQDVNSAYENPDGTWNNWKNVSKAGDPPVWRRNGSAMGICQIMPEYYDEYVENKYSNDPGRKNDDFVPYYYKNWPEIQEAAETFGVDWDNPYSAYTNFAVEMMLANEFRKQKIGNQKRDFFNILEEYNYIGECLGGENQSFKEFIFIRDSLAHADGQETWQYFQ